MFEVLDEHGALRARAHNGHVSQQHVEELREFIQRIFAHHRAKRHGAITMIRLDSVMSRHAAEAAILAPEIRALGVVR